MGNALANINSPEDFFNQFTPVAKYWLIGALGSAACVSLGGVPPTDLMYYFPFIWEKFQIWRFLTTFLFFGKFSFGFIFKIMMLVSFCWGYERDPFPTNPENGTMGRSGDFVFMLLFGATILFVVGYFASIFFLSDPLLYMVMYLWSKRHPDETVSLLFGIKVRGLYLPFAIGALSLVMGNMAAVSGVIIGSLVGHVYYFATQLLHATYGKAYINCPEWLYNLMDSNDHGNYQGEPGQPQRRANDWGGGQVLGQG